MIVFKFFIIRKSLVPNEHSLSILVSLVKQKKRRIVMVLFTSDLADYKKNLHLLFKHLLLCQRTK